MLTLDIADLGSPPRARPSQPHRGEQVADDATWIESATRPEISKWALTYARPFYAHQRMTADPVTRLRRDEAAEGSASPERRAGRQIAKRTEEVEAPSRIRAEVLNQAKETAGTRCP